MAVRYPLYFDPRLETARALAQASATLIVYKEMDVCFVRDGQTGEIKFKDTDHGKMIQYGLNLTFLQNMTTKLKFI